MLPPEINLAFNKLDLGVKALHCGRIRGRTLGQLISSSAAEEYREKLKVTTHGWIIGMG